MKTEPRLKVAYWPIAKLQPYARNPRKNDGAVDRMCKSIQEFGFTIPVLARSTGEVIDGHLRLKAGVKLKIPEVPVIVCDGWTDAQVKAFRLMVNRSVNWADWDADALAVEFLELKAMDFDLSLTGFDSREIDVFTLQANPAEDDVPPVPEVPITKLGDLWLLGEHRLLCGDSTDADSVARLLGARKPFLMVTDPPYGVEYDPEWRNDRAQAGSGSMGAPGGRALGRVTNDERDDWRESWVLFPGDVAYIWHAALHMVNVANSLTDSGFLLRAQLIWAKSHLAISRGHYHWQHEPCWYAVRKNRSAHWAGDRKQSTCWSIPKPQASETGHSTQKPVEIMRRPILNHTAKHDEVYDPFLGSGTTLIAAESTERICYGLELSPAYCDVIVKRWETLTGKTATLEAR